MAVTKVSGSRNILDELEAAVAGGSLRFETNGGPRVPGCAPHEAHGNLRIDNVLPYVMFTGAPNCTEGGSWFFDNLKQ